MVARRHGSAGIRQVLFQKKLREPRSVPLSLARYREDADSLMRSCRRAANAMTSGLKSLQSVPLCLFSTFWFVPTA